MSAFSETTSAKNNKWAKISASRIYCVTYDTGNLFKVKIKGNSNSTETTKDEYIFSGIISGETITHEDLRRQCNAAKEQTLTFTDQPEKAVVFVNLNTGEVLPEDGFYSFSQNGKFEK